MLEFGLNVFFREASSFLSQHIRQLLLRHLYLLSDGNQATRKVRVVFLKQFEGHHEVIYVVENERPAIAVCLLGLQEMDRLLSPVSTWIQMMGSMVAVVEAKAIALPRVSMRWAFNIGTLTGTSIKVILLRKSESGSTSSTRAC